MKACIISIILSKTNKTHSLNSTKYPKNHIQHHIFETQQKTQNPRNQRLETWNTLRKIKNPYLFLKIGEEMMKKMEFLRMNMVSLEEGDNEQSQYVREKWKVIENCLENNP